MKLKLKNNIWLWLARFTERNKLYMPNSVCPLFWKGIMGIVLLMLSPVLNIMKFIKSKFDKESMLFYLEKGSYNDMHHFGQFFVDKAIIFLYLVCVSIGESTFAKFNLFEPGGLHYISFIVGWLVLPVFIFICLLILVLCLELIDRLNNIKQFSIMKVPIEFIKGKINKICPTIEWTDKI